MMPESAVILSRLGFALFSMRCQVLVLVGIWQDVPCDLDYSVFGNFLVESICFLFGIVVSLGLQSVA